MPEFNYLRYVLNETGIYGAECHWKVAKGRKFVGALRSLVNARSLQLECARMLHEALIMSVLL